GESVAHLSSPEHRGGRRTGGSLSLWCGRLWAHPYTRPPATAINAGESVPPSPGPLLQHLLGLALVERICDIAARKSARPAAAVEWSGILRIEPDRFVEVREGAVVVAPPFVHATAAAQAHANLRIEPDPFTHV